MVRRFDDWEPRLVEYVVGQMQAPFLYGRLDCALFAAGAVLAMTGSDLADGYRGYRSLKGGQKRLVKQGFADHVELAASLLEEVPPALAHRGDVVVIEGEAGPALGILQGEVVYCLSLANGVVLVPRLNVLRAFRVPFPS